ncbi:MAG: BPSL0761 family protein [Variovorax sp.]
MTVPEERTEAVLRTRQFLLELADAKVTPRIPLRVRQRAISLLKHLPTGGDLALAAKARPDIFAVPGESRAVARLVRPEAAEVVSKATLAVSADPLGDLGSVRVTAAEGDVFADLGFPNEEAEDLLAEADGQSPAQSLHKGMEAGVRALPKGLLPMTDDEMQAMSAVDWLERDVDLPDSIRAYFWDSLERLADSLLLEAEGAPLRAKGDVRLYRDALLLHFARRRADEAT